MWDIGVIAWAENREGPVLSDAAWWPDLSAHACEDEAESGRALTAAPADTLFLNLSSARPVLDDPVLDGLREALSHASLARQDQRRLQVLAPSDWCLVAEHCWDPIGRAIVEYAYRFERLRAAKPGGS